MSEALEKRTLRIESPSGDKVFGRFVIGAPIAMVLELKKKYPDREWAGADPRVDEAIKQGITENEKFRIGHHLDIHPNTAFKFEFEGQGRFIDEEKEPATFESNGKKFWIFKLSS